jgi:hypothetical protein
MTKRLANLTSRVVTFLVESDRLSEPARATGSGRKGKVSYQAQMLGM